MTTDLAALAASLGHEPTAPEWDLPENPVDPGRFGKDHFSTFAYVETRTVDYKGRLGHEHMRCSPSRHPMLMSAGRSRSFSGTSSTEYPTRLQDPREELAPHDDYDCLGDLVVAGLLTVEMPHADGPVFIDPWGKVLGEFTADGYSPGFMTGMAEARLAEHARWSLTPRGHQVAGALRAHKAAGNNYAQFRLPTVPLLAG